MPPMPQAVAEEHARGGWQSAATSPEPGRIRPWSESGSPLRPRDEEDAEADADDGD
jgi:hypothetical protein